MGELCLLETGLREHLDVLLGLFGVGLVLVWTFGIPGWVGIPLSVLTALVASLTVGIGVDYCIHLSECYVDELRHGKRPLEALADSIAGTGAALFGSAVTTMGGFGVLAFAVLPTLGRFGTVTALTVGYAFVATIVVLPSLLLLWSRYVAGVEFETPRPTGSPSGSSGEDD